MHCIKKSVRTPQGWKTVLYAENDKDQLTQKDWFDLLEKLCEEDFDAIDFKTLRDSHQDYGDRRGKPYIATKDQALAYIKEWHDYFTKETSSTLYSL